MENAQASFKILRLSAASRLSHLLRPVPPSITCEAAADYDVLVEWALASIVAGDGVATAGLPVPEEVTCDPTVCQNQTYLGHEALRQVHLPIREGGLGLTSSPSIKGATYIGCHALVLERVIAASTLGSISSLLERLSERPMAAALLAELKTASTDINKSQIKECSGQFVGSLGGGKGPSKERDRDSTSRSGSRKRGPWWRGGWEREGRGGRGC